MCDQFRSLVSALHPGQAPLFFFVDDGPEGMVPPEPQLPSAIFFWVMDMVLFFRSKTAPVPQPLPPGLTLVSLPRGPFSLPARPSPVVFSCFFRLLFFVYLRFSAFAGVVSAEALVLVLF